LLRRGRTWGTANRRKFIKGVGAGALATGIGANIIVPTAARAARNTLRILQWVHYVPAYDEWFNGTYAKEWGQKNDRGCRALGIARITCPLPVTTAPVDD
jgi:hypothetical protein